MTSSRKRCVGHAKSDGSMTDTGHACRPKQARSPRRVYDAAFKLMVVREALKLPASNRIKPTCREYPGVEPVQLRKWICNRAALELAAPNAKLVQRSRAPPTDVPDLAIDDSSE